MDSIQQPEVKEYDLVTIGAGSGGVRAGRRAAGYGARVAVVDYGPLGGTCVNVGCVPKKLLVYASHFAEDARLARDFGWHVGSLDHDWNEFVARKDKEILRLNNAYRTLLHKAGVEFIEGQAQIDGPHRVVIGDRILTTRHILIATGSRPRQPLLQGSELSISSNEAFFLKNRPRKIVIAGGGYIAVEFAAIFHGLGAEVTLVHRGANFLRGFDEDIRETLRTAYLERGIDLKFNLKVEAMEKSGDGLIATLSDGAGIVTDEVMFAIGRAPLIEGLGLDTVEVKLDDAGAIIVDALSQTTAANIHAIGDVTNRMNLTPVAIAEGEALARTLFDDCPTPPDYSNVPSAIFSQPAAGTVGLSEETARLQYESVDIYKTEFRPMKQSLGNNREPSMMKLVVDKASDRVLGVHMVGSEAGEIVQGFAVALKCGATKAQFDATIGIHPTSAEEFVTMRAPET
jgi:glutathione reductase (NADPH)